MVKITFIANETGIREKLYNRNYKINEPSKLRKFLEEGRNLFYNLEFTRFNNGIVFIS